MFDLSLGLVSGRARFGHTNCDAVADHFVPAVTAGELVVDGRPLSRQGLRQVDALVSALRAVLQKHLRRRGRPVRGFDEHAVQLPVRGDPVWHQDGERRAPLRFGQRDVLRPRSVSDGPDFFADGWFELEPLVGDRFVERDLKGGDLMERLAVPERRGRE